MVTAFSNQKRNEYTNKTTYTASEHSQILLLHQQVLGIRDEFHAEMTY